MTHSSRVGFRIYKFILLLWVKTLDFTLVRINCTSKTLIEIGRKFIKNSFKYGNIIKIKSLSFINKISFIYNIKLVKMFIKTLFNISLIFINSNVKFDLMLDRLAQKFSAFVSVANNIIYRQNKMQIEWSNLISRRFYH